MNSNEGPTPNFPELKRLNLWVQAQGKIRPGARIWVQSSWITLRESEPMCRTAFCAAGMTVVRAGHVLKVNPDGDYLLDGKKSDGGDVARLSDEILGIDTHAGIYYEDDGYLAEEELEEKDRRDLYHDGNSAEDIDRKIREIFADHDVSYTRTKAAPDHKIKVS